MQDVAFQDPVLKSIFAQYPRGIREKLLQLRGLIFAVAQETEGVGKIRETLKWGQPSYLTPINKSGTSIRIDQIASSDDKFGLFVHCQTTLVDTYRSLYGDVFTFEGNRGMVFDSNNPLPEDELKHCIELALVYHQSKT